MDNNHIDLSLYQDALGQRHKLLRLLWTITWGMFARWLPRSVGKSWKRFLLRLFGARIHKTAIIYSSATIYYPANLVMEKNSCLAGDVVCYNVAPIRIGANSIVSQGSFLCTASHDITDPYFRLVTAPIVIEDQVWVGANAFIGMGVTIGQGAVVGATASVFKDVEPWTVVGGNPASFIKNRVLVDK